MLLLYLVASLAGVGLLVGLSVALFGRAATTIDMGVLVARLACEWPGFRAGERARAVAGDAALVENASDGSLHLAVARGDAIVTRRLARGTTGVVRNDATLSLRLNDFTLPDAALTLADADLAAAWQVRIARATG